MTGITTTFNPVNDGVVLALFIVGIILSARNRIPRQTVKDLQDLVSAQEARIKVLEKGRIADTKTIGTLEGQIQTYKELPLQELADGIKEVVILTKDNADSNKQILKTLQDTAKINAEDRDVLTNQNKHIHDEIHKIVDTEVTPK